MNHQDAHWARSRAILKEYPDVKKLFTHDPRTFLYAVAVVSAKIALALYARTSWFSAITLGVVLGPYLDAMILVLMHEVSHNRCSGVILYDRVLGMAANILMLAPISEVFRQHHRAHHLSLGDAHDDVDVPCPWEIQFVGNSSFKKAVWLFFNMVFLPIRSLTKLEVKWDKFVVLNFVTCIGFAAFLLLNDPKSFLFFGLSLMFSQGCHPANARQLQRHFWDGSKDKALNKQGGSSHTFSYYGPIYNALYLNVGYHNEHHDFAQVPWTRLPELKAMVGEKWYPSDSTASYASRGLGDIYNFIFNPDVSLANFYSNVGAEQRKQEHYAKHGGAPAKKLAASVADSSTEDNDDVPTDTEASSTSASDLASDSNEEDRTPATAATLPPVHSTRRRKGSSANAANTTVAARR